MPSPIVNVPADLWNDLKLLVKNPAAANVDTQDVWRRMDAVDVPDISPEAEKRRKAIIELAGDMDWVDQDGHVEVDDDARLSEGDDNGCYVSAWVWVDFAKTEFDRCCDECMEVMESEKDLHKVGDNIYCDKCYDPEAAKELEADED